MISSLSRVPCVFSYVYNVLNIGSANDIDTMIDKAISMFHINIHTTFHDFSFTTPPKILICNHTTYIDGLILYKLFKCAFLVSDTIKDIPIINNITKHMDMIQIKRGSGKNMTIPTLRSHLKKTNSKPVCIFPEGQLTNANVLGNFRSGAFVLDNSIMAVCIRYGTHIHDDDHAKFLYNLLSLNALDVYVDIVGVYSPPFDISSIQYDMANVGGLVLSRVSNRDLKD